MGEWIGRGRKARRAYGLDEIALVPGEKTIDPDDVDTSWNLGGHRIDLPIIAAAMDGVVSPDFAIAMGKLGGLAILNLEGVWTRYEDPSDILHEIANADAKKATELVQKLYEPEIKDHLIGKRIEEIKAAGSKAIVSSIPAKAEHYGDLAVEAGVDFFVIQATVVSKHHEASRYQSVDLEAFCKKMPVPIIIGNCVTYETALSLMSCNPDAILVGIGPGAACTTRGVLGLGVPQVTATVDCSAARDFHYKRTGRYIPIITDGGMSVGGDLCKALACGSDAVVIGSAFAKAKEAPGGGFHWGMATPHRHLPRGTRIKVGQTGSLEQILFGPANLDDGSQNLIGALKTCMGNVGARNLLEFQMTEICIAPAIKTEGKIFQQAQKLGMAKS